MIAVLADDLIWSTRLVSQLRAAGGDPVHARDAETFRRALATADGAIVDLTARAYDGLEALGLARDGAVPVIAVGQHDDAPVRRAARAAGATRVYAYRALLEHGPRELAAWIGTLGDAPATVTSEEER
jgi:CheY-like chemotaxis protein